MNVKNIEVSKLSDKYKEKNNRLYLLQVLFQDETSKSIFFDKEALEELDKKIHNLNKKKDKKRLNSYEEY